MARIIRLVAAIASTGPVALAVLSGQAPPQRDPVAWLETARRQAASVQEQLSAFVAEEEYVQSMRLEGTFRRRTMHSDLLFFRSETAPYWFAFRDVFDVDGRALRDRKERLTDLFLRAPGGRVQAAAITKESARYNLGSAARNVNVPTLALAYLTLGRVRTESVSTAREDGRTYVQLTFEETARPTLVRNSISGDVPVRGDVWLSSDGDTLVRTQLRWRVDPPDRIPNVMGASISVTTHYVQNERLGSVVPVRMEEVYASGFERIACTARYSNIRKFSVEVTETVP